MTTQTGWENIANGLKRKIWITKGARFNAHQRLSNRHTWSITSISFLSAYVIVISLLSFISPIPLNSTQNTVVSFSAIILSLFILVLSLLESLKSHESKSREFHDCGRQLSGVYDRLTISMEFWKSNQGNIDIQKELSDFANEYNQILDKCHENHDIIDVELFEIEHKEDFKLSRLDRAIIRLKVVWGRCLPFLLFILLPPIVIIFMLIILR